MAAFVVGSGKTINSMHEIVRVPLRDYGFSAAKISHHCSKITDFPFVTLFVM